MVKAAEEASSGPEEALVDPPEVDDVLEDAEAHADGGTEIR